jgi:hypothetical protein
LYLCARGPAARSQPAMAEAAGGVMRILDAEVS